MPILTFTPPIDPSPGASRKPAIKLLRAEFGDGYTQTTRHGMNHMRERLSLRWDYLTPTQHAEIIDFLEQHGGDTAFLYQLPGDPAPKRFTCDQWESSIEGPDRRTLSAEFMQDFNLA